MNEKLESHHTCSLIGTYIVFCLIHIHTIFPEYSQFLISQNRAKIDVHHSTLSEKLNSSPHTNVNLYNVLFDGATSENNDVYLLDILPSQLS